MAKIAFILPNTCILARTPAPIHAKTAHFSHTSCQFLRHTQQNARFSV
ncbi:hypothetical protein LNQ82_03610 [Conchiformibius steedae DSM 2580]|uniref:Uncharacterized protein n=1 Tax=Conchiformibius steedae DSM 2580 TaxID=1121352 RepID=A0AAE9KZ01_9NEIS|nr:hypothetical protein [Conchiformibius steedae]QMT33599.1 hypothetical protein H3L98_00685 [Conchiformibius steedae]URD68257.1 hypothetical protein LNQ82_03610 [Conchiformibius steedae DSM 2580]